VFAPWHEVNAHDVEMIGMTSFLKETVGLVALNPAGVVYAVQPEEPDEPDEPEEPLLDELQAASEIEAMPRPKTAKENLFIKSSKAPETENETSAETFARGRGYAQATSDAQAPYASAWGVVPPIRKRAIFPAKNWRGSSLDANRFRSDISHAKGFYQEEVFPCPICGSTVASPSSLAPAMVSGARTRSCSRHAARK
jgi:hypothetical protein